MRATLVHLCVLYASITIASTARAGGYPVAFYLAWGQAGSAPDQFMTPFGIGHDHDGYVYVVENELNRVQKYDGFGNFVLAWGSLGGLPGQFLNPEDVAVGPDGLVYVADARNRRIQKFTTNGAFVGMWSTPTPNGGSDRARGVAFDSQGDVYVAFGDPARVEKYSSEGVYLTQWDIPGNAVDPNGGALGIAISAVDDVYVVDPTASWSGVRRFTTDGTLLNEWGGFGAGPGKFYIAIDVALDDFGRVFVTDYGNDRVQVFTSTGGYLGEWGGSGAAPGQFHGPRGIDVNPSRYIFVVDGNNRRVEKFGFGPVSLRASGWGRVKAMFRTDAAVRVEAASQ